MSTAAQPQTAVCFAVLPPQGGDLLLGELRELLRTADVAVVGQVVQRRAAPDRRTYLGPGRLEELRDLVVATGATLAVCDDELTPGLQRRIEDTLGVAVLDRTAVILDIFAAHARTSEGKLQVELAQLEYTFNRMRGLWQHLERLGGGIGTRGPGETQLETDRRIARRRIAALRGRLAGARRTRATQRRARRRGGLPVVGLAGYTNAGKSTLLNALTGAGVQAADRLFETLDPTVRAYRAGDGRAVLFTDTVGFIRKLPHQLVDAFAATLEETVTADGLLHVIDASQPRPVREEQMRAVEAVLAEIGADDVPRLDVLNKVDLLDPDRRLDLRREHPDALPVSARTGEGLDALVDAVLSRFVALTPVELVLPFADGEVLASVYRDGRDVDVDHDRDDGVHVTAMLPVSAASRLDRYRVA